MQSAKVSDRQTLFDIAALKVGGFEASFDLAVLNGISLTEKLVSGREINLVEVADIDVVENLSSINARPASQDDPSALIAPGGIGYMQIGYDFKVR